jgi:hypothetical protein
MPTRGKFLNEDFNEHDGMTNRRPRTLSNDSSFNGKQEMPSPLMLIPTVRRVSRKERGESGAPPRSLVF